MLNKFELSKIKANGITHRIATVKGIPPTTRRRNNTTEPLVMLLHGWPEIWYSWRHQLLALASAGYPVCAPDLRGFGETDAPVNVQDYEVSVVCLDVLEIAKHFGFTSIVAIGHDFGSYLAWHLALLHPEQVVAVCGMSVPFLGHSPKDEPLLSKLQRHFGTCLPQEPYNATRKEQETARFHYILHHNLPLCDFEYDRNCNEALYRLYSFKTPRHDDDPPEVTDKHMFPSNYPRNNNDTSRLLDAQSAPGFWARLPRPKTLPSFLSHDDFEYLAQQHRNSGFAGGLRWYQVLDINWFQTRHLKRNKIEQPSLFLIGAQDHAVIQNHGGMENLVRGMQQNCLNLDEYIILPGAGHWIQQECYDQVNAALLKFLSCLSTAMPLAIKL
jgi:pimeloyl-ACP methyl ester carboxylesterase